MTLQESTTLLLSDRAAACLLLALHYLRRALAPIGVIVNAVVAMGRRRGSQPRPSFSWPAPRWSAEPESTGVVPGSGRVE